MASMIKLAIINVFFPAPEKSMNLMAYSNALILYLIHPNVVVCRMEN